MKAWNAFLDSIVTKGGQFLVIILFNVGYLWVLIHYWKTFDSQLQTTLLAVYTGINGTFVGYFGASHDKSPGATPPPPSAATATVTLDPTLGGGSPISVQASTSDKTFGAAGIPGTAPIGFAPRNPGVGNVGDRGEAGELGENSRARP